MEQRSRIDPRILGGVSRNVKMRAPPGVGPTVFRIFHNELLLIAPVGALTNPGKAPRFVQESRGTLLTVARDDGTNTE